MMATSALSSLAEANIMMVRAIYNILNVLQPTRWNSREQVIYYPVDDRESHFRQYEEIRETQKVLLPFAGVTRSADLSIATGYANPALGTATFEGGIVGRNVVLEYAVNVYEERHVHLENLVDRFVISLFTSGRLSFQYRSRPLGGAINELSLDFEEPPTFNEIPGHSEIREGSGSVYSLTFTPKAYTMLGRVGAEPNLIARIQSGFEAGGDRLDAAEAGRIVDGLLLLGAAAEGTDGPSQAVPEAPLLADPAFWRPPADPLDPPRLDLRFAAGGGRYVIHRVQSQDDGVRVAILDEASGRPVDAVPAGLTEVRFGRLRLALSAATVEGRAGFFWPGASLGGNRVTVEVLGTPTTVRRRVLGRYSMEADPTQEGGTRNLEAVERGEVEPTAVRYDGETEELVVTFAADPVASGLYAVATDDLVLPVGRAAADGATFRWRTPPPRWA